MDTASFHLIWGQDGCRAQLRGHVDESRLNALLRLVAGDQPLRLDLREAHISPGALSALGRLAAIRPHLRLEPATLMEFVRAPGGTAAPEMDIMAILAHELRSPLALAHTRLQTLAQTLAAAGRTLEAEVCRRSTRDLATATRLFDFYLTAAQPWHLDAVALADVAAQCLRALEDLAEVDQVSFRLDTDGPAVAYGHPRALQQLIHNLALNAAQACGVAGEVRVRVHQDGHGVEITVADDGPGFPAEILQRPFVPYRTDRTRGTGLGLVICKWIVDRHRGQMTLANLARGAVVTVVLPQAPPDLAPPERTLVPAAPPRAAP